MIRWYTGALVAFHKDVVTGNLSVRTSNVAVWAVSEVEAELRIRLTRQEQYSAEQGWEIIVDIKGWDAAYIEGVHYHLVRQIMPDDKGSSGGSPASTSAPK